MNNKPVPHLVFIAIALTIFVIFTQNVVESWASQEACSLPQTGDSIILVVVALICLAGSLIGLALIARFKRKKSSHVKYPDI